MIIGTLTGAIIGIAADVFRSLELVVFATYFSTLTAAFDFIYRMILALITAEPWLGIMKLFQEQDILLVL